MTLEQKIWQRVMEHKFGSKVMKSHGKVGNSSVT